MLNKNNRGVPIAPGLKALVYTPLGRSPVNGAEGRSLNTCAETSRALRPGGVYCRRSPQNTQQSQSHDVSHGRTPLNANSCQSDHTAKGRETAAHSVVSFVMPQLRGDIDRPGSAATKPKRPRRAGAPPHSIGCRVSRRPAKLENASSVACLLECGDRPCGAGASPLWLAPAGQ